MSTQASIKSSPSYLMHGRSSQVPSNTAKVSKEFTPSAKRCLKAYQEAMSSNLLTWPMTITQTVISSWPQGKLKLREHTKRKK